MNCAPRGQKRFVASQVQKVVCFAGTMKNVGKSYFVELKLLIALTYLRNVSLSFDILRQTAMIHDRIHTGIFSQQHSKPRVVYEFPVRRKNPPSSWAIQDKNASRFDSCNRFCKKKK